MSPENRKVLNDLLREDGLDDVLLEVARWCDDQAERDLAALRHGMTWRQWWERQAAALRQLSEAEN